MKLRTTKRRRRNEHKSKETKNLCKAKAILFCHHRMLRDAHNAIQGHLRPSSSSLLCNTVLHWITQEEALTSFKLPCQALVYLNWLFRCVSKFLGEQALKQSGEFQGHPTHWTITLHKRCMMRSTKQLLDSQKYFWKIKLKLQCFFSFFLLKHLRL